MLRGAVGDVRHFADHVIAERGVRHGRLVLVPVEERFETHTHGGRWPRRTSTCTSAAAEPRRPPPMQQLVAWARDVWPYLFTVLWIGSAAWVTVDAVLRKRHAHAVVGWIGLAWLAPITGALAYYLLGINRIHRQATRARASRRHGPGRQREPCAARRRAALPRSIHATPASRDWCGSASA